MADITTTPSGTYEISIDWGISSATLGVRVLDNAGATTIARATGFTEYPASSGVYYKSTTAPSTVGQYTLLIDDDGGTAATGHVATIDLLVTNDVVTASGTAYISVSNLKTTLNIGSTYADADVTVAVNAASRTIDAYMGVPDGAFVPQTQTRYYSPGRCDRQVSVGPVNTVTSVTLDTDGDGTYETTWTEGTDFILTPVNADTDGNPYTELVILPQSGRSFPGYLSGLKIVGSFGWATTPAQVTQATTLIAGRLLKRARETPYGMLVVAGDTVSAARLGKVDPDVALVLANVNGSVPLLAI